VEEALMKSKILTAFLAFGVLVGVVGCEPPAPKISNQQAETHQQEKDQRDGHYTRTKN
jgi:hypothetical protein